MLKSFVIKIISKKNVNLPPTLGSAAHGFFLKMVKQTDEKLAGELHKAYAAKPFTISTLMGNFEKEGDLLRIKELDKYYIRVTSLTQNLSQALDEILNKEKGRELNLLGGEFVIEDFTDDKVENSLAGIDEYQDIFKRWINADASSRSFALVFTSPTTFRQGKKNMPFPLPGLVFNHLIKKWNIFSPFYLGDNLPEIIDDSLFISRYTLKTKILDFGEYRRVGFVGQMRYAFAKPISPLFYNIINILADYAFYAGVGYKTTMGMGQTHRDRGVF